MKILLFCNSGWNIYNFRLNFIKKISKKNEVYSLSSKDKYIYKIKKNLKKIFM